MTLKERFKAIVGWFEANVPVAETELHYGNPYELLVAVILSAQCTDRRVNIVTRPCTSASPPRPTWLPPPSTRSIPM